MYNFEMMKMEDFRSKSTHKSVICVKCVDKYIEKCINEKPLPCLTSGCKEIMERHDIKNIAMKEISEKYNKQFFF